VALEIFLTEKREVFFWLLLKDTLNTIGLLQRKNIALEHYNYVLCGHNIEESLLHLFLACPFAAQYMNTLHLQTGGFIDPFDILDSLRRYLQFIFFLEMLM
jgi:hypothetical protein